MTLQVPSRRVAIKTLGCRLNQAETAHMEADLRAAGFALVPFDDPADVYVVHSCAVTANAERNTARHARAARRRNPDAQVIVAGCAAVYGGSALGRRAGADLLLDQQQKFDLPRLLGAEPGPCVSGGSPWTGSRTRAILKVQDGCDFGCAYCMVPLARGPARSLPFQECLATARDLSDAGVREVVLTGVNLGCYRDGRHGLSDLVRAIAGLDGIARLRLSSIELSTAEDEVLDLLEDCPKLCRYLHIPLQSGSDRILERMGRRYNTARYRAFMEKAARRFPGMGLGTDLIAGYPGETPSEFRQSMSLLAELPINNVHAFPYSERPGTRAAGHDSSVPVAERHRRVRELLALAARKRDAYGATFVGRPVEVLVEQEAPDGWTGWTSEYVEARISPPLNACPVDKVMANTVLGVVPDAWHAGRLVARLRVIQPAGGPRPSHH